MANSSNGHLGTAPSRSATNLARSSLTGSARIVTQLRRAILDGIYGYRERVPSERELAAEFGAARGTVRSALSGGFY